MTDFINVYDIKRYVDGKTYKAGINLFSNAKIDINIDYNNELFFYKIESEFDDGNNKYRVSTNIKKNDKNGIFEIKDSACNCILGGRCPHDTALLLKLSKYTEQDITMILKGVSNKSTTNELLMLEQKILNKYNNSASSEDYRYEIEPILLFKENKVFMELRIGNLNSHLYSISDVYEFYQRFETNEVYEYSNKFSCIHIRDYLVDKFPGLNDFVMAKIKSNMNLIDTFTESTASRRNSYDKKYIEVTENDLGILLNLFQKKAMHIKYFNKSKVFEKSVFSRFDDLQLNVDIIKDSDKYILKLLNDTEYTFYGEQYILSIVDNSIICTTIQSQEDAIFVDMLLKDNLEICANEFDRIYDNVIKERLKFIKLIDNSEFDEDCIESIKLHLYVDINKANNLIIKRKLFKNNVVIKSDVEDFLKRKNVLALEDLIGKFLVKDRYVIKNVDDVFDFYNRVLFKIQSIADEVFLSEQFRSVKILSKPKVFTSVKLQGEKIKITLDIDNQEIKHLKKLLRDLNEKKKYYRLENGDFLSLDNSDLDEINNIIAGVNAKSIKLNNDYIEIDRYNALYIDKVLTNSSLTSIRKDVSFNQLVEDIETIKNEPLSVPKQLNATLRDYQIEGYNFLSTMKKNRFGVILADDMGLGKTIQVITLLLKQKGVSIVVCPSSLVLNWASELEKFAPSIKVGLVKDSKEKRTRLIENHNEYDLLITSYDTLKRDIEDYSDIHFDSIIIDEAQYIKNPNTKGSHVVKEISAEYHLALTGTPIENNLTELWSIFDFIIPGYLSSYYNFHKNFEIPIVKENDLEVEKKLINLVSPFIIRRMKKDVLKELPEKMETIMYCEFEKEQRDIYDAHVYKMKSSLESKTDEEYNSSKIEILSMLMKLRQICCDPNLIVDEENEYHSAKLELAMELIHTSIDGGHKILLFSQFTSMLDIISHRLKKQGVEHHMLTGSVKASKRMKIVEQFNTDDTKVFLISLKAGGTGLNLTKADVVIHYDPWWNVSSEMQATDRAHRIGQENKVNVYKLIAKDTIEESIVDLQTSKKKLSDSIIKDSNNPFTSISKLDFEKLI